MSLVGSAAKHSLRFVRPWQTFIFWLSIALVFVVHMGAQAGLGWVTGRAIDASGAVVPAASVRITNVATQVSLESVTSSDGIYNFNSLNPGNYRLEAKKAGF